MLELLNPSEVFGEWSMSAGHTLGLRTSPGWAMLAVGGRPCEEHRSALL